MEAKREMNVLGVRLTLSVSMFARLLAHAKPPLTGTAPILYLPAKPMCQIIDKVDSSDLHNLSLTNHGFHIGVQTMRWRHAHLIGRPHHMSILIRHMLEIAQHANSVIKLELIERISIIVPPDPFKKAPVPQAVFGWALVDDREYWSFSSPELGNKIVQLLNLLSNKKLCPGLKHITIDLSGVGHRAIHRFTKELKASLHPVNIESLRIKDNVRLIPVSDNAAVSLAGYCMASRLKTLHISDPTVWFDVKHDLSPSHWQNLRKLHFAVGNITEELDTKDWIKAPALEWLSIDGWDRNYSRDSQVQKTITERRAQNIANACPNLKRLAITWRGTRGQTSTSAYFEPVAGFPEILSPYFHRCRSLELLTLRWVYPQLIEFEREGEQTMRALTRRDALRQPRKDGWPSICPSN